MRMKLLASAFVLTMTSVPWVSAGKGTGLADERQLLNAAIQEGHLLWYAVPLPFNDVVFQEFKKKYPEIRLEMFKAGGTQIVQRFELEQERGAIGADCVSSGLTEAFPDLRRRGYLADLDKLPNWKRTSAWSRDPNGSYFHYVNFKVGIAYNKNFIKDAPDSYAALADPKWKDKIALFDTTAGITVPLFRFIIEQPSLGWDWVDRLKRNQPLLMVNGAQVEEAVTSGRRPLAIITDTGASDAQHRGAPIGFRLPKEGFMLHLMPIAVNRKASHPNAARLFVNWLMSDDTQKRLSQERVGVPVQVDENALKATGGWYLDPEKVDPAETKRFMDRLNQVLHSP